MRYDETTEATHTERRDRRTVGESGETRDSSLVRLERMQECLCPSEQENGEKGEF